MAENRCGDSSQGGDDKGGIPGGCGAAPVAEGEAAEAPIEVAGEWAGFRPPPAAAVTGTPLGRWALELGAAAEAPPILTKMISVHYDSIKIHPS